jgi:hypothetical protein
MRKLIFLLSGFLACATLSAQELNCTVKVESAQIQSSDKKIFETLETSIFEFMNNRRWTNDQYLNQERIECNILINITERISNDEFKATLQVQSRRPVYKSSYNSTVFNFLDNDFSFRYLEFQQLEFIDNAFTTNLTSVLAFYANIIIGLDYDTFSPDGGSPYFLRAQNIVNNAQNAPEKGWKAFEGTRNRYWLTENLMSPIFRPQRECMYKYHRGGLDIMSDNKENGRAAVTEAIELLRKVHSERPGAFLMQLFFNAKTDEIISIYSQAFPDEKNRIINTLTVIDPSNGSKYQQEIMKGQ